jgi:preprotein translocase subunit YajC
MTKMPLLFLAQQSTGQTPSSGLWMLMFYGLFAGALYFFLIAPQRKKQKDLEKMIGTLAAGDEVITTGGIYGTIASVKADRFVVRIADNTKIEVGKGFVQAVVSKAGDTKSK